MYRLGTLWLGTLWPACQKIRMQPLMSYSSCSLRRALCTYTLLRVDWEHEAALAIAQQRTIDTLEAGIAAGGDPEALLDAAEAEDIAEEGTGHHGLCRCLRL